MSYLRRRRDMFIIPIIPEIIATTEMPIPHAFLRKYEDKMGSLVNLCFPNGSIFQCRYLKSKKCFKGLFPIIEELKIEISAMVLFERVTNFDFMVTVIGPSCVEIRYPLSNTFVPYSAANSKGVASSSSCNPVEHNGMELLTLHNWALHQFNGITSLDRSLEIHITGADVFIEDTSVELLQKDREKIVLWEDGWCLYFSVAEKAWEVVVRRLGKLNQLCEGWEEVIRDLAIQTGDCVTLIENGNPCHFQIVVFRQFEVLCQSIDTGDYMPNEFIKRVTPALLMSAELMIPRLFWCKAADRIGENVSLIDVRGRQTRCTHCLNTHKLRSLECFLKKNNIKADCVLLFRLCARGVFIVNVFGKTAVSM